MGTTDRLAGSDANQIPLSVRNTILDSLLVDAISCERIGTRSTPSGRRKESGGEQRVEPCRLVMMKPLVMLRNAHTTACYAVN